MGTVDLRSVSDLRRVLAGCCYEIERITRRAMLESARWGLGRVVRATNRAGVSATRTFVNAWFVKDLNDGAVLANSAAHATFVERGRKAGKMPPVSVIEAWIREKGITPSGVNNSHADAKKYAYGKGIVGSASNGRARRADGRFLRQQSVRLQKIAAKRVANYKSDVAKGHRRTQAIKAMALAVARKIKRRGTKGKFLLGHQLQPMYRMFQRRLRQGLRQLSANPPR